MRAGPGQDWSALLLSRGFDAGPGLAASGPLAFSLGLLASRLVLDGLTRRYSRATLAVFAAAAVVAGTGVGMLVALGGGPVGQALAAIALAGVGAGPIFPLMFGAAENLSRRYGIAPATTASLVSALSRTGAITAPAAVGGLAASAGLAAVFAVMAAGGLVVLCTLPLALRQDNRSWLRSS